MEKMQSDEKNILFCVLCRFPIQKGQYSLCKECKLPCCLDCIRHDQLTLCSSRCAQKYAKNLFFLS